MAAIKPFREEVEEEGTQSTVVLPEASQATVEPTLDPATPPLGGIVEHASTRASRQAELVRMWWIRQELTKALSEYRFRIGEDKGRAAIYLVDKDGRDAEIPKDYIPWFAGPMDHGKYAFFTQNTKMACPTWDLPSGAANIGGTCPNAAACQSIVPKVTRENAKAAMLPPPGSTSKLRVNEDEAICACLTGDALILVRGEGLVRIDSLIDREVEVWSGKAWRKTHARFTGFRDVVKVRTNWGLTLRCTPDHRLLTRHGFMEAQDTEDQPLAQEYPPEPPFAEQVDLPFRPKDGKDYRASVEAHFPHEWTFDVGLMLGAVLGDGSVSGKVYKTVAIAVGEQDRDLLDKLQNAAANWCGTWAEVHVEAKLRAPPKTLVANVTQKMARIGWRAQPLVEFLIGLGLDKSGDPENYHVPAAIFTASREGVQGFLSGLFATDGSVTCGQNKIEVSLASVSRRLVEEVQQLLFAFGIRSTICGYETSNEWRVQQGYRPLWKVCINAFDHVRRFEEHIGFAVERKRARLTELVAAHERKGEAVLRFPYAVSIEEQLVEEPVYDLVDVGEEHQFVANGISAHNCCYASGGNYPSPHVQAGEMVKFWWIATCMKSEAGREEFIATMVEAVLAENRKPTRHGIRPFRIHSSGDFFSPTYFDAWCEIARRVEKLDPSVRFWAPTRVWGQRHFDWGQLRGMKNLVVRPSAYHVGDFAPEELVEGQARGTTAIYHSDNEGMGAERERLAWSQLPETKRAALRSHFERVRVRKGLGVGIGADRRFDWNCQAYAVAADAKGQDLAKSCTNAVGPDGKVGCRACWLNRALRICYTVH